MFRLATLERTGGEGQGNGTGKHDGLFREEALAQLAAPDQIDTLMRVLTPRWWFPLLSLGGIIGLALVWAVFGRIPVTLPGRGVLIRPGKVIGLQSTAAGQLQLLCIHEGGYIQKGGVVGEIDQAGLRQQLELERSKLAGQRAEYANLLAFQEKREALEKTLLGFRRKDLQQRVEDTQSLAERLKKATKQSIQQQRENLTKALELSKGISKIEKERFAVGRKLFQARALSWDELRQTEQSYLQVLGKELDLQAQLQQLELLTEQVEDSYFEKMDRITQMKSRINETLIEEKTIEQQTLELTANHKLALEETRRNIARLELILEKQGKILSEHSGRVLEITAAVGQVINPGTKVATVLDEDQSSPLVCLSYFRVKDGKRIAPRMQARIAPDPVQRERSGSLICAVQSVTPFPVSREAAINTIGNSEVARVLVGEDRHMEVFLDLEVDPSTPSGYAWTSSRGPESKMTAGTTVNVEVEVESRVPISFLLPFLREWAGSR